MTDFHQIVSKALKDTQFCKDLVAHPEETLLQNGVTPTKEMIEAIQGLDAVAVQKLAAAFNKQQAAV